MINKLHREYLDQSLQGVTFTGVSVDSAGDIRTAGTEKGHGDTSLMTIYHEWHDSGHEHGDCSHYGNSIVVI